ncbi:phenylacetate--CoA ligase family protein [Streptomyces roseirectus]|uniref:Phenylacetate--CoA ligase family protein n=1 Tax=Streptomyces roseirectus TaxID=2768066 RepID=A0A7H0IPM7_9ACTN|nr:AMP-binding protein [Streptomyces roseirectus]QNP74743.1 phenylacetate--CoA ligase family protein [Streptomyces roseirectus]
MTDPHMNLPRLGQWHGPEDLLRIQEKQLPRTVAQAARSPFYRRRLEGGALPATAADLTGLPLTTKQDLRDHYPFGMLAVPKAHLATYHESSGTAGRPTPSYYTAQDWTDLAERFARKWIGISDEDVFLVRTPYALLLTGHLAHAAARLSGATVVPGDNRSLAMPYARVVRTLHDLGVTLTWSVPTECLIWAAAATAAGHRPDTDFPALRALFVGGEPLTPARRRRISRLWGVPVIEEYGSTETGSLAGECPAGRMHLWADRALFEVYDPHTGKVAQEGEGRLVVTPLFREAMPLLRYNLDDDVVVSYDDCDCGWHLPTVQVLGRAAFGHRVGAATITQHRLEDLVFSLPESHGVLFWRAKAEPALLRIEIEVAEEHRRAAVADLTAAVRSAFGVDSEVTGLPPGTLIPREALTALPDVVKPRGLFGPDEDWGKALLYY